MKNMGDIKGFIGRHKGASCAACIAIVLIVVIILLAVPSCERQSGVGDDNSTENNIPQTARGEGAPRNEAGGRTSSTTAQADGTTTALKESETDTGGSDDGIGNGGGDAPAGDGRSEPPAARAPEKHRVIDYTQVWVEDSAAWDEQVPVYGYIEVSICNICGTDITGNEVAHGKAHMLAG